MNFPGLFTIIENGKTDIGICRRSKIKYYVEL
jgi:hypothetical protein